LTNTSKTGAIQLAAGHYLAGRVLEAEQIYRKLMADHPSLPMAIAYYRQAVNQQAVNLPGSLPGDLPGNLHGDDPNNALLLALALRLNGQLAESIAAFERVKQLNPTDAVIDLEQSRLLSIVGRLDEARAAVDRAVALQPASPLAHSRLAEFLLQSGQLDEADAACRRAIELNPRMPSFYVQLGQVLNRKNLPGEAQSACIAALECAPDCASAFLARAELLADLKAFDEALADYRRAILLLPDDAGPLVSMSRTLQARGDFAKAELSCRRALTIDERSAPAWECLGRLYQITGQFEKSVECLRRSLEIAPSGVASLHLVMMPHPVQPAETQQLAALLNSPDVAARDRVAAGFALGKVLDDAGEFDQAFSAYASANALFKTVSAQQGHFFDAQDLARTIDQQIATFTPGYFAARADFGDPSDLPVFIVGMPRSGTTLVEQIAASHSRVVGAGELNEIGSIRAMLNPNAPLEVARQQHRQLAQIHLAQLARMGGGAARVIDKMPANILYLGVIAALFPNARVILCERDARDTCLSCFFQLFAKNNLMFSYDLVDCATQYHQQQRITRHWKKVLPLRMLEVQYETLVADPETQSRRIIDFLELDWQPDCLDFHKLNRPILTRSVWQVRQRIYANSVGRWKNYQHHLNELLTALAGSADES
jgi:tetratricopeptide (TPR) repeat protein